MQITELYWKNYKSYGNTFTRLKLKDTGELILIQGNSGDGKTSIMDIFDYTLYGEVANKAGKRLTQKNFPNRINQNLEAGITFKNDDTYTITRKMDSSTAPIKTTLNINDAPYTKANKVNDKIIDGVGMDYKTFKSFISMNITNFKNFISLTPEEKRLLLDKLFNLEMINELNKVLKNLIKLNDTNHLSLNKEINVYNENINQLQNTINLVNEKNKINKDSKLVELKETLSINETKITEIEKSKNDIEETIELYNTKLQELQLKVQGIKSDIKDITFKINLYEQGKCPTCHTVLTEKLNLLPEFNERLTKTNEVKTKLEKKISAGNTELFNLRKDYKETESNYNKLMFSINDAKNQIKNLSKEDTNNIKDFENNLLLLKTKVENKQVEYLETSKLKTVYDLLTPVWSESGIKRDIIESIVTPLNEYIDEDLKYLKTRFKVEIDNNFDAHIYEYGNEIDSDTLSNGEDKKINLIIMLAYIKMLRMQKNINILFLDEVFSGLDLTSIEDMLILFKKFANERNINVFLVHHAELKEHFFDRVISVKKSTFSYIEDVTF